MTGENVRANVADEIRLADTALRAAAALLDLAIAPDGPRTGRLRPSRRLRQRAGKRTDHQAC